MGFHFCPMQSKKIEEMLSKYPHCLSYEYFFPVAYRLYNYKPGGFSGLRKLVGSWVSILNSAAALHTFPEQHLLGTKTCARCKKKKWKSLDPALVGKKGCKGLTV